MTDSLITRVEVGSSPIRADEFEVARARLEDVLPGFSQKQNNFAATVARRELVKLCVQVAKEHGYDI